MTLVTIDPQRFCSLELSPANDRNKARGHPAFAKNRRGLFPVALIDLLYGFLMLYQFISGFKYIVE
jgi:hypothetical protein